MPSKKNQIIVKFEYKFIILYLVIGGLWIKFSDDILSSLVKDPALITKIQTFKGWFYVLATALIFFFILNEHLKKIRKAEQKATQSDRLKSMFLQNISHEIRTPMNGIIGFSELLTRHNLSEKSQKEYIEIIKQSSLQLLNIVNDLLDISMIETGNVSIRRQAFSLNQLIDDIAFIYKPILPENIQLNISKGLPDDNCRIITDKSKLQQILNNLINNASKYTQEGQIYLGYTQENSQLHFFIQDTGIGIPDEMQEYIFNRFLKAHEGFTKEYQGVGLGLAICKGHLDLLGGSIRVQSKLDEGTTMTFSIPYEPEI